MAVLAPALVVLRAEIDKKWPNRDRSTDGWIGDTSHAASGLPENGGSDHNPNRRGVVDAIDIDVDGINCPTVVAAAIRHPSTHYVIWNRHIWSKDYLDSNGLPRQRNYSGADPHTNHIHVSLTQSTTAENRRTAWGLAKLPSTVPTELSWAQRLAASMPQVKAKSTARTTVTRVQALLNAAGSKLVIDGLFGPATTAAVKAFQSANRLAVDGIVGPKTWGALLGPMLTVRRGSTGVDVSRAQALLITNGVKVAVDGLFGPATEAAVKLVQRRYDLAVDGIVGPVTWTALATR